MKVLRPLSVFCATFAAVAGSADAVIAQGVQVEGVVRSEENARPIACVLVKVKDGEAGMLTNLAGEFRIMVERSADTLVVERFGLISAEVPIAFDPGVAVLDGVNVTLRRVPRDSRGFLVDLDVRTLPASEAPEPIYLVDDEVMASESFEALNPQEIESVRLMHVDGAYERFGELACGGVVVVQTRRGVDSSQ